MVEEKCRVLESWKEIGEAQLVGSVVSCQLSAKLLQKTDSSSVHRTHFRRAAIARLARLQTNRVC